jgi:hypothetical protein
MALTVADLAEHITTRRRFYALALEADIELLRRAHGESVVQEALRLADEAAHPPASTEHASDTALDRVESVVQEALRLADEAAQPQAPQVLPPTNAKRDDIAAALDRVMGRR